MEERMDMEEPSDEEIREVLKNVVIVCRLYSLANTSFRSEQIHSPTASNKKNIVTETNFGYVCIKRKTVGDVYDSITQLGLSPSITCDTINSMFEQFSRRETPLCKNRYMIVGNRLVSREIEKEASVRSLIIFDTYGINDEACVSFHISLLKQYLPLTLEHVDHFAVTPRTSSAKEKEEKQVSDVQKAQRCIVCKKRWCDIIIKPCHHYVICLACTHTLADTYACPVCNTDIDELHRVRLYYKKSDEK